MRSVFFRAATALAAGAAVCVLAVGPAGASGVYVVWAVQATIGAPAPAQPTMWGVQCMGVNGTDCVAVGEEFGARVNGQPTYSPLAMTLTGSGWTVEAPPNPGPQSYLAGVSCTSFSVCLAVGSKGDQGVGVAEYWNGSAWSAAATPSAARALSSDSCNTVLNNWRVHVLTCTAVGWGNSGPLAESYYQGRWTAETVPSPAGATWAYLDGVSCPNANACTAVGWYTNSSGVDFPFVERSNGFTWSVVSTPATDGVFSSVSCPSTTECMAVGYFGTKPLSEYWNGATWTMEPVPGWGTSQSVLTSVFCVSTSICTAVGGSTAESWVTSGWAALPMPAPPGTGTAFAANGVGCWTPDFCLAVGAGYTNGVGEIEVDQSLPIT